VRFSWRGGKTPNPLSLSPFLVASVYLRATADLCLSTGCPHNLQHNNSHRALVTAGILPPIPRRVIYFTSLAALVSLHGARRDAPRHPDTQTDVKCRYQWHCQSHPPTLRSSHCCLPPSTSSSSTHIRCRPSPSPSHRLQATGHNVRTPLAEQRRARRLVFIPSLPTLATHNEGRPGTVPFLRLAILHPGHQRHASSPQPSVLSIVRRLLRAVPSSPSSSPLPTASAPLLALAGRDL